MYHFQIQIDRVVAIFGDNVLGREFWDCGEEGSLHEAILELAEKHGEPDQIIYDI